MSKARSIRKMLLPHVRFTVQRMMIAIAVFGLMCWIWLNFPPPYRELILITAIPIIGACWVRLNFRHRLSQGPEPNLHTERRDPNQGLLARDPILNAMVGTARAGIVTWIMTMCEIIYIFIAKDNKIYFKYIIVSCIMTSIIFSFIMIFAYIVGLFTGIFWGLCERIVTLFAARFRPVK